MDGEEYRDWLESVRSASPVLEVVRHYTGERGKDQGDRVWFCSPLRSEKNPSFCVYVNQENWHDFGLQEGGDVFDLVQRMEPGIDTLTAAANFLAKMAEIPAWGAGRQDDFDEETEEALAQISERRRITRILTAAANYYHRSLTKKDREFLRDTYGFNDDTIDELKIGWATGSLWTYLRDTEKIPEEHLIQTGLFIKTKRGPIEHLEYRYVFPYFYQGKVVYMIGRRKEGVTPDTDYQLAKYKKLLVHSERHDYVSKTLDNSTFWGQDSARRGGAVLWVTEGVTDAISLYQSNLPVVSPVTTRFRERDHDKLIKLSERFDKVLIVNDNEAPKTDARTGKVIQPGLDGAIKTAHRVFEAGRDVRIVTLPRGQGVDKVDLNDFMRQNNAKDLLLLGSAAPRFIEFLISRIPEDTPLTELDLPLRRIYSLLANRPSLECAGYVQAICKRFKITKKTVLDSLDEFTKNTANGSNGASGGGNSPPSSSSSPAGSLPPPPKGGRISGCIFENEKESFYYVAGEDDISRISNFAIEPLQKVNMQHGSRYLCNIHTMLGPKYEKVILPANSFHSTRDLIKTLQGVNSQLAWTGKDANVGGLVEHLSEFDVETLKGVPTLGYVETSKGPRWVTAEHIIGPDGIMKDPEIAYAPMLPSAIHDRHNYLSADMDEDLLKPLAQRIIPQIWGLNTPEVTLPMTGWFYASMIAPVIRRHLGHMPILWVFGSQGCGKSSLVRDIFWPLVGVTGEPFACSTTQFALITLMASTTSIVIPLDEMKPDLAQRFRDYVFRMLRQIYNGEIEQRGRPDRSVDRYALQAPMAVISEIMPVEPAVLERLVCVSPMKHELTLERQNTMARLVGEPLTHLAGSFVRWVLNQDLDSIINLARARMNTSMVSQLSEKLSPRLYDNMLVIVIGDVLHREWCMHMGVDMSQRPRLRDHFKTILANITSNEEGGGVKDALDGFLEQLSTYAQLNIIEENIHYVKVKTNGTTGQQLCLWIEGCYQAYLQERKRQGRPDETNGLVALKRVAKENLESGRYVTHLNKRVALSSGSRPRCIAINLAQIPEHLAVDFPIRNVRSHGGWRRGDDN